MAGLYDLFLLIDPNAPEERRTAAISEAESLMTSGGALVASHDWGQRRMAYEINKNAEGIYAVLEVACEPATVAELDRQLGLNESVLRTKVLRREPKRAPAAAAAS